MLAPMPAIAVTAKVQSLPGWLFSAVFWAASATLVTLLILCISNWLRNRHLQRSLSKHQQQLTQAQAQFDSLASGIVLYDQDYRILYANRMAAYILGQKAESLAGKSVDNYLPETLSEPLHKALRGAKEQSLHTCLPARNREYRVRVIPKLPELTGCTGQLIFDDIHRLQQSIDDSHALHQHLMTLWDDEHIGVITVCDHDNTVTVSRWLSNQLKSPVTAADQLVLISTEGHKSTLLRVLDAAREGRHDAAEISLQGRGCLIPVRLSAYPYTGPHDSRQLIHLTVTSKAGEQAQQTQARQATQRFQAVTSTLPHACYLIDADHRVQECNRQFASTFGLDPMRIKGKAIDELPCFDDAFTALHTRPANMASSTTTLPITVGEQQKTLRVHTQGIFEDGIQSGLLVIAEDISEQVRLDKQHQLSQQRLRAFIDHAPMGVAIFDAEHAIVEVNQTLSNQLDTSPSTLCQQHFEDLFAKDNEAGDALRKLQRQDRFAELPVAVQGANGSVSATMYASKISEIPEQFVCWVADRDEQDYLNNRFERLLKYASIPVAVLTETGFSHLNAAACAFFGVQDEDELLGVGPDAPLLNAPEQDVSALTSKLTIARTHGQVQTFTWQHRYQNQTLPSELTLIPLVRDGELESIICLWVDLRALEQANAARQEAVQLRDAAQLEVAETQQQLVSSQHELSARAAVLAKTEQSLASAEQKLNAAEDDLSEKLATITHLQQAHEDVSAHLASLQGEYQENQALLAESQRANSQLEEQLAQSSAKVGRLEAQRHQIANKLQYSEKQYRQAQDQLSQSRRETARLKDAQQQQQTEVDSYRDKIDELRSSIADKDTQLADVSEQINALQLQLTSSQDTSDKLKTQLDNQRKASAEAERQRREIELACRQAEAELSAKARNIEHLQHEMEMLEAMSQQEKGDMQAHAEQLQKELTAKQTQLEETASALTAIREQAEQDKQEKASHQQTLERLQREMLEAQQRAATQQAEMAEREAQRQAEHEELQRALQEKQTQLAETTENLQAAIEQNQTATDEQARQQKILDQLEEEMQSARANAELQQQKLAALNEEHRQEHARLQAELKRKQQQLQDTQTFLQDAKQQTQAEKAEKARQQAIFDNLQQELQNLESASAAQQQAIQDTDEARRAEQAELEKALQSRQQQLDEAQQALHASQRLMEEEKQARLAQEEKLASLEAEMSAMQARATEQTQAMSASEAERSREQQRLAEELANKQAELEAAHQALQDREAQMEAEKLSRQAQQDKLEQLQAELADVAQRAAKQQEMMSGNDAQWREHHEEIEAQKKQLQAALQQAESQNAAMQSQLSQSREALSDAEGKVSLTREEENKLQAALESARQEAAALNEQLGQREAHEQQLQEQVAAQQATLHAREQHIEDLSKQQRELTEKLAAVEADYAKTRASLKEQDSSQSELNSQLQALEQQLQESKSQLSSKEAALSQAQTQLNDSKSKLAEQEKVLVDAQKAQLHQEAGEREPQRDVPEFANLPMPADANVWFDLLPYLQQQQQVGSLAQSLTSLMENLSAAVAQTDQAVNDGDTKSMLLATRKLTTVLNTVPAEPLNDMATRLQADCEAKNVDNISIFWPIARQNLQKTLRVIYSHLVS
ncbi:PAS domain S-box protein [Alteromonas sp. ASW11-19]|uniref:PAS domain S-box protein n=1 Tax=Alteromonas salexigens TaxID=2982530 RepID=A0ABT2VLV8_9ALTE|nr:PAS domain S-box protein [Alteromonas salexigens]MCU7553423.1 PAS domain S-box protein [Alteromonas salexigens]